MHRLQRLGLSVTTAACIVAFSATFLFADTVRGAVVSTVTMLARTDFEATVEVEVGDLVMVELGERHRYLDGIRAELVVGNTLKQYADSFGFAIYSDIGQPAAAEVQNYVAERQLTHVLPFQNRIYFTVLLGSVGSVQSLVPTEVLAPILRAERFSLLVEVQ